MQEKDDGEEKIKGVKILVFDLYDTLVDLEGTIAERVENLRLNVDAQTFATSWRKNYWLETDKVTIKERDWTPLEDLLDEGLEETLQVFGLNDLSDEEKASLKSAWTSPNPYPDTREGLESLQRKGYVLAAMSNASETIQRQIAKRIGIDFGHYFSSDKVKTFKPAPEFFKQALVLGTPQQIMMVAESESDLNGAASDNVGFQTAYIYRAHRGDIPTELTYNTVARDILGLATQLGTVL